MGLGLGQINLLQDPRALLFRWLRFAIHIRCAGGHFLRFTCCLAFLLEGNGCAQRRVTGREFGVFGRTRSDFQFCEQRATRVRGDALDAARTRTQAKPVQRQRSPRLAFQRTRIDRHWVQALEPRNVALRGN